MLLSRTIIVTGANTGLGFATAKALAADPTTLAVIAARNQGLGQEAVRQISACGGSAVFLEIDLGDQASVRRFVDRFRSMERPPLFGIVGNAGTQDVATPQVTAQGYESTFAINHLGHYLLIRLLLNDMVMHGRIALVSSSTHDPKEKTGMPEPVYEDAKSAACDMAPGRKAALRRYTTSKLCNVLFTYELSRRLAESGDARLASISVDVMDPGLMPATGLARSWPAHLRWVSRNILPLMRFLNSNVHRPEVSARRLAALMTRPEEDLGGHYFSNGSVRASSVLSYDQLRQKELWRSSAAMTGLPCNTL